ncbi:MAG TPA: cytochrome P450 [Polyangium sp.]|nr:cytochrome P450 [Polyangium sp.]
MSTRPRASSAVIGTAKAMTQPSLGTPNTEESRTKTWERAARVEDLRDDGPFALSAGGQEIVAVRTNGELRVFEGRCPHQGALLGEGGVEGNALVCRNHRWQFDRTTGRRIGGKQCLRVCPSRVEQGELWVDVSALTAKADSAATRTIADLPGPRPLPWIGNVHQLRGTPAHLVAEEWSRMYGSIYVLRFGKRPIVVVTDPRLTLPILRDRPETFRRINKLEPTLEELGVAGVFSAEGDAWRAQRRLAMEALSQKHLRGFFPTLANVAERLRKRWERAADERRELDICDELERFTVDVTTLLVFGHDLNTIEHDDDDVIQQHLELLFPAIGRRLHSLFPYWRYFKLPKDKKVDRAVAALRAWLETLVAETRAKLAAEPQRAEAPANFLEAMVAARDADGRPFEDKIVIGNGFTMLLAGEDTTAYSLAWTIHHLCDDARATQALRAESDRLLGDRWLDADLEQAGKLAYANAAANESMRLRPVAPGLIMEPMKDVVIGDVAIPRGVPIALMCRLPNLSAERFSRPNEFVPERWIDPGAGPHDASAFIPFGSGPRLCPGRALALLEMRVVLSMLYRNFDVERIGASEDVREGVAFTMHPVNLRVRLLRRRA